MKQRYRYHAVYLQLAPEQITVFKTFRFSSGIAQNKQSCFFATSIDSESARKPFINHDQGFNINNMHRPPSFFLIAIFFCLEPAARSLWGSIKKDKL